jgi:membrane-bound ClpP family serine protease
MRSGLVAAFMGIGGIFLCFSLVVFILGLFARQGDVGHQLGTMNLVTVATFVVGVVLFGLGYLLARVGRSTRSEEVTTTR